MSVLSENGSIVNEYGTRWSGSIVARNEGIVGTPKTDGTGWTTDAWAYVDYGEATPPAPPPPTEQKL